MASSLKKLLIGASVAAGMSAIASAPAFAASLKPSSIQFTTNGVANTTANPPNINTWTYAPGSPVYDSTGISGVQRRVLNDYNNYGNMDKAAAALTDDDSATNVELWTSGETVGAHVGFTANLGSNNIKVESLTKADWADGKLATAWVNGFLSTYAPLLQSIGLTPTESQKTDIIGYLTNNGFNSAGDPNVGAVTFNDQTGALKVDLVGHLDISGKFVNLSNPNNKSPDYDRNKSGNPLLDNALLALARASLRDKRPLQVSEIAKITFNGNVDYAYSFSAVDSKAIAGDRKDTTSHTGIYTWTKNYNQSSPPPTEKSVPEPSTLLGLMALGGLIAAQRKVPKKV